MPRASSARRSGTNWDRFLHSTAMSDGRTPAARPSGHGCPSGADPAGSASSAAACAGHPLRLVGHRGQQRAAHRAAAAAVGRGLQHRHVRRLRPQLRLEHGGRVEHPARVAEAGGQQPHRCVGSPIWRGSPGRTGAGCPRSRRASRRSTGTGRRPRSPGGRRRTGRAAAPAARGWCPGTRRAAPRGSAPVRRRRPPGGRAAIRAASATWSPWSSTSRARFRRGVPVDQRQQLLPAPAAIR